MRASDLNSNFTDTRSDCLHRFPVVWIQTLLHGRNWNPASRRGKAGNARKSPRELPSQISGLSGIGTDQYTSFCILPLASRTTFQWVVLRWVAIRRRYRSESIHDCPDSGAVVE